MRVTSALLAILLCASALAQVPVRLHSEQRQQRIDGFGGAIPEQCLRQIYQHPQREQILKLFFADLKPQIIRIDNCFGRDGADFSIRSGYPYVLKQARKLSGREVDVLISSTSPPTRLKSNGMLEGGTLVQRDGAFDYSGFARWWDASLQQYEAAGVHPAYLSIQEEPDFAAKRPGCRLLEREMMRDGVLCASYPAAMAAVRQRLAARPAAPALIGPEVMGIGWDTVQRYGDQMQASPPYALAHHLEHGGQFDQPESFVTEMRGLSTYATRMRLPIFQTQCARLKPDADAYRESLNLAQLIHHALADEQVSAFLYGDLVESSGRGLVEVGDDIKIRPVYYALRHYAQFIPKGCVRIGIDAPAPLKAAAFQNSDGSATVVILLNPGTSAVDVPLPANTKQIIQTTREKPWITLPSLDRIPPQSIVTITW